MASPKITVKKTKNLNLNPFFNRTTNKHHPNRTPTIPPRIEAPKSEKNSQDTALTAELACEHNNSKGYLATPRTKAPNICIICC
jgi:hypothetical protein